MRWLWLIVAVAACGRSDIFEPHVPPSKPKPDAGRPDAGPSCDGGSCDVAATLDGLRWELPCVSDWPNAPEWVCITTPDRTTTARLSGRANATYEITLRLRGVLETAAYTGASGDGGLIARGGQHGGDAWNIYRLEVSSPPQYWFLNSGPSGLYHCVAVDETLAVRAQGGAIVTLFASAVDSNLTEIKNHSADAGAIVVPGVPPAPKAFDGQFLQMDVLSVHEL